MVISFQLENVRNHLLEHGMVYTMPSKPHKEGKDWANSGRTTKKIADVKITEIYPSKDEYLGDYLKDSGFKTINEWIEAYLKLNNDFMLYNMRLFKIELISVGMEDKNY
jgi:hypothetical protein